MTTTRLFNRPQSAILRSPLHPLMSDRTLLLEFNGRRTGTPYATPVMYLQQGNELLTSTDSRWWRNFREPAAAAVWLRGRRFPVTAHAATDPDEVAAGILTIVQAMPSYAKWVHVRHKRDGKVDFAQVRSAIKDRVLLRIHLVGAAVKGTESRRSAS